ncbi:hypothetical protein BHE74_00039507 [Ensete ventricosum]|nr:hypothetical protein BHE74_00039507 [Ensete ventricosum]
MSPSYDCASSGLLCAEDNNSILGFGDEEEQRGDRPSRVSEPERCDFYVDLPLQSDECLSLLVEREQKHLPREDYGERLRSGDLHLAFRRDAIDWMWKAGFSYYFSFYCS